MVGARELGGPRVTVLDVATGSTLANFFAYDFDLRGGVYVAAGDLDGDGRAELLTGPGPAGGPQVNVYDGRTFAARGSFLAAGPGDRRGVRVGVGEVLPSSFRVVRTAPDGEPPAGFDGKFGPAELGIFVG